MPHSRNGLRFHEANKKQFKENQLRRYISTEIEVCGFVGSLREARDANEIICGEVQASIVGDGSLPELGFEINTQPANGDVFLRDIRRICDALNPQSYVSRSAGLHVHVNAKDMHHNELRNLVLLYAKLEDALFALCASHRRNGDYSRLCARKYLNSSDPREFRKKLVESMYHCEHYENSDRGSHLREAKNHKYHDSRYSALNLHSYFFRGTVEFRHHEGTIDPTTIINWALVCAHVVEAAAKLPHRVIQNLPSGEAGLLQLLPPHLAKWAKEERSRQN